MTLTKTDFLTAAQPLASDLMTYARQESSNAVTDVKVIITHKAEQTNTRENQKLTLASSGQNLSVSIKLYAGDRSLSISKNTLDKDTLQKAIQQNIPLLPLVPENKNNALLAPDQICQEPETTEKINSVTQEALSNYALHIDNALLSQPSIIKSQINVNTTNIHQLIAATNGLNRYSHTTLYTISANAFSQDQKTKKQQSGYDFAMVEDFNYLPPPEQMGYNAAHNAAEKLGATTPQTMKNVPIILSQDAAQSFFQSVCQAIDGEAVYRHETFLKDKTGQQVMSKGVTIIDDPQIPGGLNSQFTDSAGMESKKMTFIKDGVLKSYLINLKEARQLGIPPIGREDGRTNSFVLPGIKTPEELAKDIPDGIFIKEFHGGKAQTHDGLYSRPASGVLIKNGIITNIAVDGFAVAGNLKEMFMNVTLANDTPSLPDPRYTFAVPTTRIDGMTIVGQGKG